jgi:hypothetical protein
MRLNGRKIFIIVTILFGAYDKIKIFLKILF